MTSFILQFVVAALALVSLWLIGNRTLWGPLTSCLCGLPYLYINIDYHLYGFIPMTIALMFIDARNFVKWRREGVSWRSNNGSNSA